MEQVFFHVITRHLAFKCASYRAFVAVVTSKQQANFLKPRILCSVNWYEYFIIIYLWNVTNNCHFKKSKKPKLEIIAFCIIKMSNNVNVTFANLLEILGTHF